MERDKLQDSLAPGGVHHRLAQLVGEWEGTTRTWFKPEQLADESPWKGVIRPALGGRFVIHEYEGAFAGEPFQGVAIYGYNLAKEQFESAWIDSFHMSSGIMFATGRPTEQALSVLGHYDAPEGPPWGWRTEITVVHADEIVITAYNIIPNRAEAKAVETIYRRVS